MDRERIVDTIAELQRDKFEIFKKEMGITEDVLIYSPYTETRKCDGMLFTDGIPDKYFTLLEKYAITLFQDYECSNEELQNYLDVIIEMMTEYFELSKVPHQLTTIEKAVPKYSEKDEKRKITQMQKVAKTLLGLSLCNTIGSPLHDRLSKELNSVINNPKSYLFPKIKLHTNSIDKQFQIYLKEYLYKLPLLKQKTTIAKFLNELSEETEKMHLS